MANDTIVTIIGNLVADPELRFTPAGVAVANFTIASTPRHFDRSRNEWVDDDALFLRCTLWREPAEHIVESFIRGTRVIAQGRLQQRSYETREGEKRTVYEMQVDEIGPSIRYATVKINRITRAGQQAGPARDSDDPWAATAQSPAWGSEEPPANAPDQPATVGAKADPTMFPDEPPF